MNIKSILAVIFAVAVFAGVGFGCYAMRNVGTAAPDAQEAARATTMVNQGTQKTAQLIAEQNAIEAVQVQLQVAKQQLAALQKQQPKEHHNENR